MSAWCYEGKQPAAGYGMARAICNMAHALYGVGKMDKHVQKLAPYSQVKMKYEADLDRAEREGRTEEFMRDRDLYSNDSDETIDPDNWMRS